MESLKERICAAFCEDVQAKPISNGYAIATPYKNRMGDRIGIYAISDDGGIFRIVDTALTVAHLEADGVTFDNATRQSNFFSLLSEYDAKYDPELGEIYIPEVKEDDLPRKLINFSLLLLRLNDMVWTTSERTKSTFRDDVRAALRKELADRAKITEDEPVSDRLMEVAPDMVFHAPERDPVALFIATEESKLWQAMMLQMLAAHEAKEALVVVALIERQDRLSTKVLAKADNRLDAIPRYEDEPGIALQRIVREVVGRLPAPAH